MDWKKKKFSQSPHITSHRWEIYLKHSHTHTHTCYTRSKKKNHKKSIHAKSLININEWKVFAISNYIYIFLDTDFLSILIGFSPVVMYTKLVLRFFCEFKHTKSRKKIKLLLWFTEFFPWRIQCVNTASSNHKSRLIWSKMTKTEKMQFEIHTQKKLHSI